MEIGLYLYGQRPFVSNYFRCWLYSMFYFGLSGDSIATGEKDDTDIYVVKLQDYI
jgi:hypothetical protein